MLRDGRFYLVVGMWVAIIGYAIAGTYIYNAGKNKGKSEALWVSWMHQCRRVCYTEVLSLKGFDLCEQDCQVQYWRSLGE